MEIEKVLVVGGTHGNELTGVFLLNHWLEDNSDFSKYQFTTEFLLANQKAIDLDKRYVDKDLNRSFLVQSLKDKRLKSHEDLLARKIVKKYGPKTSSSYNFIIDMHTSTSAMGITLMIESNRFNLQIAEYVRRFVPDVNIYCFEKSNRTQSCLRSLTPYAIGVEIGPVAQSLFCHKTINKMKQTVYSILDGINSVCQEEYDMEAYKVIDVYEHVKDVPYPDEVVGSKFLIHSELEGKNYKPLKKGEPLFVDLDGESINYNGEENLCPVFVNEAAYYDKNIAFSLVKKGSLIR